jgi:Protein of unknown function (DUF2946)
MRKLGAWLGIVALALQAAWPLLAGAKPRDVMLVPLCTVDGVAHYVEVPTGKTPPDPSSHGEHCPLCCLGHGAVLPLHVSPADSFERAAADRPSPPAGPAPRVVVRGAAARAPPSPASSTA